MSRISKRSIAIVLGVGLIGAVAYAAGLASRPATPAQATPTADSTDALFNWLGVSNQQRADLRAHDPAFAQNLQSLRADLAAKRAAFASALDDPQSSDAAIHAKLEAVLGADAALERRIAGFLLAVRHHLTAPQQRQLFGVCAEGVRRGPGWRWGGGGPGAGMGPGSGRGMGMGRGGPPWMNNQSSGPGAGPGMGMRGRGWGRAAAPASAPATQPAIPSSESAQ